MNTVDLRPAPQIAGGGTACGLLLAPSERVIGVAAHHRGAKFGLGQLIEGVETVAERAVAGHVAIGIVGDGLAAAARGDLCQLVLGVGDISNNA